MSYPRLPFTGSCAVNNNKFVNAQTTIMIIMIIMIIAIMIIMIIMIL